MTKFRVDVCQNLTECDTFNENDDGPTTRVLYTEYFDTEAEALDYYSKKKVSQKFFGVAGQYVCYPVKETDGPQTNL